MDSREPQDLRFMTVYEPLLEENRLHILLLRFPNYADLMCATRDDLEKLKTLLNYAASLCEAICDKRYITPKKI